MQCILKVIVNIISPLSNTSKTGMFRDYFLLTKAEQV